jgi:hypothetical protein
LRALGVIEITALIAERIIVAVHLDKGLFAHVTRTLALKLRPLGEILRLRSLEPQGRIHGRTALHAQSGGGEHLPIVRLRGLALGASKRFCHLGQFVSFRLGHQTGKRQEFATPFLRQAVQVGSIVLDGAQNAHARIDVVDRQRQGSGLMRFHGPIVLCRSALRRSDSPSHRTGVGPPGAR